MNSGDDRVELVDLRKIPFDQGVHFNGMIRDHFITAVSDSDGTWYGRVQHNKAKLPAEYGPYETRREAYLAAKFEYYREYLVESDFRDYLNLDDHGDLKRIEEKTFIGMRELQQEDFDRLEEIFSRVLKKFGWEDDPDKIWDL